MSSSSPIYARNLNEIPQAFMLKPLDKETFDAYYCGDTMSTRTGDSHLSPIKQLFDECTMPGAQSAYMFKGHTGCGKSTELVFLQKLLEEAGHPVAMIKCATEVDRRRLEHTDLLIIMAKALFTIAANVNCSIDTKMLEKILHYWSEKQILREETDAVATSIQAGAGVSSPAIFKTILNFFAKAQTELRFGDEKRTLIRETVKQSSSEWISCVETVAVKITNHLEGKHPIIILEDLDKLDAEVAWKVFAPNAETLSGMPFPVIYSFPIALNYFPNFRMLASYYKQYTLPMIKIKTPERAEYEPGIKVLKEIVRKRADPDLFEEEALELMIKKTGGLLRDLFELITNAAFRARSRQSPRIEKEDAIRVIINMSSELTKSFDASYYKVLKQVHADYKQIDDTEKQLAMMQALVVLEYNGERWCALHPMVEDYLFELGIIEK